MRRNNYGRSRGGRSGNGGGRGGRSGRRGGGGGRGGRRGGRHPRASAQSGNARERITVESGSLILIDQFMLANPQFLERIKHVIDEAPERKNEIVEFFGGAVVELEPGTYRIERDPYAYSIIVHPDGEGPEGRISRDSAISLGRAFVDTRCLAMVDRELLDDSALLERYQQLWFSGQDKACRDLLRDNGGAVRYGFQRHGDELGIYRVPDSQILCLWPDITDASHSDSLNAGPEHVEGSETDSSDVDHSEEGGTNFGQRF